MCVIKWGIIKLVFIMGLEKFYNGYLYIRDVENIEVVYFKRFGLSLGVSFVVMCLGGYWRVIGIVFMLRG